MKGTVNSPDPIERIQYFIRSNGVADVYLHDNITEPDPEVEDSQYAADEVYFIIDSDKASADDILSDFDYWFKAGENLDSHHLANEFSLAEMQKSKLYDVGEECTGIIYAGIDVQLSDGPAHFSLTDKDQLDLFGCQAKIAAGATKIEYHSDGNPCKYYTVEDMQTIIQQAMFYVGYHTTYCNALNMWIRGSEKPSQVAEVFYGADVPEEYQSEVLKDYLAQIAALAGGSEA
jgi:hypothetical protein